MDKKWNAPVRTLTLVICIVLNISLTLFAGNGQAGIFSWNDSPLVSIGDKEYGVEEFTNWWDNWREKGMDLPGTTDPYIDWLLFAAEAENMALYENQQYQHDLNVYLKVLSLVRLKKEEIDNRIDYSSENLQAFYQSRYTPVWQINAIIYKDLASAEKTYADLQSGALDVADLILASRKLAKQDLATNPHGSEVIDVEALKQSSGEEEKLLAVAENLRKRPADIQPEWKEKLIAMNKGSFSPPVAWQESYVILHLVDVAEDNDADFANMEKEIRNQYRKQQESILTGKLIERLILKYNVTIDWERISAMDFEAAGTVYSDEPVISFGTMNVSERDLADKIKKDLEVNKKYGFKGEHIDKMSRRVVNSIVSQTLITLESLDRDYEKHSPVKELFEFSRKHKLVVRLDEHIKSQLPEISDEELDSYYMDHLNEFSSPQIYRMAIIKSKDEGLLKKIWLEVVVNGKDVMTATSERLGVKPEINSYPSSHLSEKIKEMAAKLAKGDLSQVFASGEEYAMIYFLESIAPKTPELKEVRGLIAARLERQRFEDARKEYLAALRNKYRIEINQKTWSKLREQLVGENEK